MGKMHIAEDSPAKLVLEKSLTARDIWRGWGKYFVNPVVTLAILYAGLYVLKSSSTLSPPAWLYWAIGAGAVIVELFAIYAVLYAEWKITVEIDLRSSVASRTVTLVSGKRQKRETALGNVSRVVLHQYAEIREPRLELEVSDPSNFIIAAYSDLQSDTSHEAATNDMSTIPSLESLGKKIGQRLQKPVVQKITEVDVNETPVSEEVLQP